MTRLAQCPSCHGEFELADADIGHTFQCECGANLFACDASGFKSVPLFCSGCGEDYTVDVTEIGESMECECGHIITVPDVVFRVSIAASGDLSDIENADEPSVGCPACDAQYVFNLDDVGQTAECDCGCVFKISKDRSGNPVAQRVAPSPAPLIVSEPQEPTARTKSKHGASRVEKPPTNWFALISVGSVVVFLLIAIVLFLFRERPTSEKVAANASDTSQESDLPGAVAKVAIESSQRGDSNGQEAARMVDGNSEDASISTGEKSTQLPVTPEVPAADRTAAGGLKTAIRQPKVIRLPKPDPPRPLVPVIAAKPTGYTFERAFRECFEAYDETTKKKNDAKLSDSAEDVAAYHAQLGTTLGLMQQAHEIGMRSGETDQLHELRYLMTYLYYNAGYLPEAAIFGEAVARWGDPSQPATREAAMIALGAMQEANAIQWGQAENVAELRQMQSIASVVSTRWPDEPQLGAIWMSLAQLYEVFGYPKESSIAYGMVPESSEHYAAAQLAAGQALWATYLDESTTSSEVSSAMAELLQDARKQMENGAEALQSENLVPSKTLLSAKLTLARMAMRADDAEEAIRWIDQPPSAVSSSITVSKDEASEQLIHVTPEFFRLTFETLFQARSQLNDLVGAQDALQKMSETLGPESTGDVGKMILGVATEYIAKMSAAENVTSEQIDELTELTIPLIQQESSLSYSNILWVGESWSKVASRAPTPALAQQCYQRAAEAYERAMNRSDFPDKSRQSGWLRRIDLLRNAGKPTEALVVIEQLLSETPNAFALQMEAARALQEKAIADGKPQELLSAINGPAGAGKSGGSAIWGWGKLVTTLYEKRFSESGTESTKEQLLESQYHLVNCQWLMTKATDDAEMRRTKTDDISRQLKKILTTTSSDSEPWFSKLQKLDAEVSAK